MVQYCRLDSIENHLSLYQLDTFYQLFIRVKIKTAEYVSENF